MLIRLHRIALEKTGEEINIKRTDVVLLTSEDLEKQPYIHPTPIPSTSQAAVSGNTN
jgi:hypothetical protein